MLWDGAYGFSSLSEKTRKSNRLQMSLQRQHFLLRYLKTLSVGPVGVRTRDLLLSRPALFQLSQPGGGSLSRCHNKRYLLLKQLLVAPSYYKITPISHRKKCLLLNLVLIKVVLVNDAIFVTNPFSCHLYIFIFFKFYALHFNPALGGSHNPNQLQVHQVRPLKTHGF